MVRCSVHIQQDSIHVQVETAIYKIYLKRQLQIPKNSKSRTNRCVHLTSEKSTHAHTSRQSYTSFFARSVANVAQLYVLWL